MFWIEIVYAIWYSQQSTHNQGALQQLEEQLRILEDTVLTPLLGCIEFSPPLESAVDNLKELVSYRSSMVLKVEY